jgi:FkbM family methyltransferase
VLIRDPRIRAVGRWIPGASPVYHAVVRGYLRRRGVARLDYAPADIRVGATSDEILHLRLRPVAKEPWTVDWLERHMRRSDDVLYDVGANIGVYTLIACKAAPAGASVVAVEPAYATFASLCDNLVLNRCADRVTPLPVVLGDATRLGSLSYRDTAAGAAIHELDGGGGGAFRQTVLVYALDDLIDRFGLPVPTLVKLDVDGAEGAVLAGARATLRRPELRSVLVEVETAQTDTVLRELGDAGFELERRVDDRYGEPLPDIWYGIFARAER